MYAYTRHAGKRGGVRTDHEGGLVMEPSNAQLTEAHIFEYLRCSPGAFSLKKQTTNTPLVYVDDGYFAKVSASNSLDSCQGRAKFTWESSTRLMMRRQNNGQTKSVQDKSIRYGKYQQGLWHANRFSHFPCNQGDSFHTYFMYCIPNQAGADDCASGPSWVPGPLTVNEGQMCGADFNMFYAPYDGVTGIGGAGVDVATVAPPVGGDESGSGEFGSPGTPPALVDSNPIGVTDVGVRVSYAAGYAAGYASNVGVQPVAPLVGGDESGDGEFGSG